MSNLYDVRIEKVSRRHNHGYRYKITVWWDKKNDKGDLSWSYTLPGARRLAKKLIKKHEDEEPKSQVIEEYQLPRLTANREKEQ